MILVGEDKLLTVCLYIDGTASQRALRLLDQLRASAGLGTQWDLWVGIDTPSYDLALYTAAEHKRERRVVWMESSKPRGQEMWWRALKANVRSRYMLLLNDSVTLLEDWFETLRAILVEEQDTPLVAFSQRSLGELSKPTAYEAALLIKTSWYRDISSNSSAIAGLPQLSILPTAEAVRLGIELSNDSPEYPLEDLIFDRFPETPESLDSAPALMSVCLCTYGHHPDLILRCLDSILREPTTSENREIILGCNDVSAHVMTEIERRAINHPYGVLIRSPYNFNKSGMQRLTFRLARAPYILSLDDDMYFKYGWTPLMEESIQANHPFEAAGDLHTLTNRSWWSGKKRPYEQFVERKKWWRDKKPHGVEVHFPAGQCFVARTRFMLEHDYPDLDMRIDWDDVLLGDLVTQMDGRLLWLPLPLRERIVIEKIESRGQHGGG